MRRSLILAGLVLSSAVLPAGANAHYTAPCQGHAYGSHTLGVFVGNDAPRVYNIGGRAYVDDRSAVDGGNGLWIYVESNGQSGLQRGGVSLLGDTDYCRESATPDLLVF